MAIKITGFDPDANEPVESDRRPATRRTSTDSTRSTEATARPAREIRKSVDAKTADYLFMKYGITNAKYSELAPKKSKEAQSYKSGASHRGGGGGRLSQKPEKENFDGEAAAAPEAALESSDGD